MGLLARSNAGGAGAVAPTTARAYRFPWGSLSLSLGIVALAMAVGLGYGSVLIPPTTLVKILLSRLPMVNIDANWPAGWEAIIWDLRLPRVVMAGLVGAALSLSGAAYQGLFRNPLADPYLIGAAGGAGLGATIIMVSPLPIEVGGVSVVALAAFVGALVAVTAAYLLARAGGGVPTTTLILAGVAVASLAGSITTLLMMRASPDIRPIFSWLLGGLAQARWRDALLLLPYLGLSGAVLLTYGRILNVLQLDEDQARQLGVSVERTKLVLVVAASLATAAAVAVAGLIGFVGLIAPHAVRLLRGPDHRTLLPLAATAGASFLILADLAARTVSRPGELPVGVVTAMVGAPFFLYLLRRAKREVF